MLTAYITVDKYWTTYLRLNFAYLPVCAHIFHASPIEITTIYDQSSSGTSSIIKYKIMLEYSGWVQGSSI